MINFGMQDTYLISVSAAIKVNNFKKCLEYPYKFLFIFTVSSFEKRNEISNCNAWYNIWINREAKPNEGFRGTNIRY